MREDMVRVGMGTADLRYRAEFSKWHAKVLVRSHRLWERYLATTAGMGENLIHDRAEQLEHFTDRQMRGQLDEEMASPRLDPHGSPIPPE